jgi:glycosyltransferase involved in cell wall biosynthesis
MTFDITIPVLNEEKTLRQNILVLHTFLSQHFPNNGQWKIVIAENGSTDSTLSIAQTLCKEKRNIACIELPERGVGRALKTSWLQSKADFVGMMDLDLATDLRHFPEAYNAIAEKGYEFVYGSRLHKNSKIIGRKIIREITSRVFNMLLRIYFGNRFSDGQCGFKFVRTDAFKTLHDNGAVTNEWFFLSEILIVAEHIGLKVYELPVVWTDDPDSKVNIPSLTQRYLKAMYVLKKRLGEREK